MCVSSGDWVGISSSDWSVGVCWISRSDLVGVSVAGRDWVVSDGGSLDDWGSVRAVVSIISVRVATISWCNCMCDWSSGDCSVVGTSVRVATISISWSCDDCAGSSDEC